MIFHTLMYRPQGFKFKDYNISKDFEYALLQYDYKDTIYDMYMLINMIRKLKVVVQV